MNCCVIDDEPLAAALISSYIERMPMLRLGGVYHSAPEAVKAVTDGAYDLVFLDINMPLLSGMEFARIVPPHTKVIFITAYDSHAVEAFRVGAVDYLLKPVSFEEFSAAVTRVAERFASAEQSAEAADDSLYVKNGHRHERIDASSILYIEGLKDYVKLHLSDDRRVVTLSSMRAIESRLPADRFLRVHRSYIVNCAAIASVERSRLYLTDGTEVSIGDSYRQAVTTRLLNRT